MSSPYRESVRCEPEVIRAPKQKRPLSKHVVHGTLFALSLPMFDVLYELNNYYPSVHTTWWTTVAAIAGFMNLCIWAGRATYPL